MGVATVEISQRITDTVLKPIPIHVASDKLGYETLSNQPGAGTGNASEGFFHHQVMPHT